MSNLHRKRSYGFNTRRLHRAFDRLLNYYLISFKIKTGYWYYLRLLWTEDGLSQRHLSELNNVAENTTALIVAAMQKDELVYRMRDPDDRRRWLVFLTDKGKLLRDDVEPFADKVNRIGTAGIPKAELASWLNVTARMAENLETVFRMESEGVVKTVEDRADT